MLRTSLFAAALSLLLVGSYDLVGRAEPGQGGGGGRGAGGGQAGTAIRQTPPTIEERTTGMQKLDGYFPLYWDERAGSLWLEIPRFDAEFLYTTGLSAGLGSNDIGLDRGQE
ncbi:MAG TPA: hypothetical protein VNZ26_02815, partial [Vicinamibacterales bacterium]|nr:hypothetical protein [Vicinamibacterales bacterium]